MHHYCKYPIEKVHIIKVRSRELCSRQSRRPLQSHLARPVDTKSSEDLRLLRQGTKTFFEKKKEEAYSDIVKVVVGMVGAAARDEKRAEERHWLVSANMHGPLLTRAGTELPRGPPRSPNR